LKGADECFQSIGGNAHKAIFFAIRVGGDYFAAALAILHFESPNGQL
jgi:hypothetical protein